MTRIDMDAVLDESIKTAVHFLEKFGEFFRLLSRRIAMVRFAMYKRGERMNAHRQMR